MIMMQTIMQFRAATTAAQVRTGDKTISTNVKAGKIQVCRVTFNATGKSTVTPITGYLAVNDALAHLSQMGV